MSDPSTSTDDEPQQMEVVVPEMPVRVPKRVHVDPDSPSTVLPDPKRPRLALDKDQKGTVLKFIMMSHLRISACMNPEQYSSIITNIHTMTQITSIFITVHNLLRQAANNSGRLHQSIGENATIKHAGRAYTASWTFLKKLITDTATYYRLAYTKPHSSDRNHWWGTAAPIMSFIAGFSLRRSELRVGHASFAIRKDSNQTSLVSTSAYGLAGAHHILLEGISYPPEKRTSMAQSLGPMTTMIMVARHGDDHTYGNKWLTAAKRDLSHIPDIDTILELVKGKTAPEIRNVFTLLADILLITSARNASRAFFPAALLVSVMTDTDKQNALRYTNPTTISDLPIETVPSSYSWIDFSGKGAFALYKRSMNTRFYYPDNTTPENAAQIIFHSIWGTFSEDIGILNWMAPGVDFKTREELGDAFKGLGQASGVMPVPLPEIKYYSKLTSACQTSFLATGQQQIISMSRFSGFKNQIYSDKFKGYYGTEAPEAGIGGRSISAIIGSLTRTKEYVWRKIKESRREKLGTLEWKDMAKLGPEGEEEGDGVTNIVPETSGKLFLTSGKEAERLLIL